MHAKANTARSPYLSAGQYPRPLSASSSGYILIDQFERALMKGSTRWIADLNEFFRNFTFGTETFDLYARGKTRNRGLFLSRFFAWTALPDYSVSLFCSNESGVNLTVERLRRKMDAVFQAIRENELKWAWLIVLSDREFTPQVVSFVSRYERRELGLGVASTESGQMVSSNNQIGRSIGKYLGFKKLLRSSTHGETN